MKSFLFYLLTIVLLLIADVFQIIRNKQLNDQVFQLKKNLISSDISNSYYSELRENYFASILLQDYSINKYLILSDYYNNKTTLSKIITDKSTLVIYFNEIGCSSCNENKINLILKNLNKACIDKYLVLTRFENFGEFKFTVENSLLNKSSCYNSGITFNVSNNQFDKILLFILDDKMTVKYPFILSSEDTTEIEKYFSILSSLNYKY